MLFSTSNLLATLAFTLLATIGAQAGFIDKPSVVTYWGQNSRGGPNTQKPLSHYCDDSSDIIIMAFVLDFHDGSLPLLNLANACNGPTFPGTQLLDCPTVGEDIKTCQSRGKTVLMSLGGAAGIYGFSNDADAEAFADTLWNVFGGGQSSTRPFGDAVLDGFDLDIEGGGPTGYTALIKRLRKHFASDDSKNYYITGAPQCPYPDAMLGEALNSAYFDAVNVQFYNNYCSATGSNFNFDTWNTWAKDVSLNKDVKILMGIPGSRQAAGSGYVPYDTLKSVVEDVYNTYPSFGGVTIWDASASYGNTEVYPSYQDAVADMIHNLKPSSHHKTKTTTSAMTTTTTTTTTAISTSVSTTTKSKHKTTKHKTTKHKKSKHKKSKHKKSKHKKSKHKKSKHEKSKHEKSKHKKGKHEKSKHKKGKHEKSKHEKTKHEKTKHKTKHKTETTLYTSTTTASPTQYTTTTTTTTSPSSTGTSSSHSTCIRNGDPCSTEGELACSGDSFATCDHGAWVLRSCPRTLTCFSTTNGLSIYCGQGTSGNTCSVASPTDIMSQTLNSNNFADNFINDVKKHHRKGKSSKKSKNLVGPTAKPYKNERLIAEFSVVQAKNGHFEALINARRLEQNSFGQNVFVQFKVNNKIKITSVKHGHVTQNGNQVKIRYYNGNKETMGAIISMEGTYSTGVFIAPNVNSMKFS
ncbi:glycoside hydrolase superfamily [Cokeromyces recurvatus]|uniref:glycoside hydrolase superfamily n=1 Tax=Cokeromyces recurvatus TaxID=90255 RepID=UPI0022203867|nr:glycoside hydrolase superfamily [Cokeromyces recurvatus]KAI7898494.1 glycoside hydrolase superfamily [Cokeromyces recurvatus]